MNDPTRRPFKLIQGGREALDRQLLNLCLFGPAEAFRAAIDAIKPRGRLTLVKPPDAQPPPSGPTSGPPHDGYSRE